MTLVVLEDLRGRLLRAPGCSAPQKGACMDEDLPPSLPDCCHGWVWYWSDHDWSGYDMQRVTSLIP